MGLGTARQWHVAARIRFGLVPARVVVEEVAAVADLLAVGINVVLVTDPDGGQVARPPEGRGRLAVLVGRITDPLVLAAAEEMATELFGDR
jgi:hypothetical protein